MAGSVFMGLICGTAMRYKGKGSVFLFDFIVQSQFLGGALVVRVGDVFKVASASLCRCVRERSCRMHSFRVSERG